MSSPEAGDGEEIYCICRSSDCSTFMIGCDRCNEWYHGHCINLTQEESNYIKHFYCHVCRGKDPLLKIKYKHKKRDKEHEREKARLKERKRHAEKHRSSSDKHKDREKSKKHDKYKEKRKDTEKGRDKLHGEKMREKSLVEKAREKMLQEVMKESLKEKMPEAMSTIKKEPPKEPPKEPSKEPAKEIVKEPVKEVIKEPVVLPVTPTKPQTSPQAAKADLSPSTHKMTSRSSAAVKKSARRCGECISCHRNEDCGRCDYCKDMKKFGGPNKIRQKCRLRQCLNFGTKMKVTKVKEMASEGVQRSVTAVTVHEYTQILSDRDDTDPDYMYSSPGYSTPKRESVRSDSDFSTPGRKRGKKAEKKQKESKVKKSPGRARSKRKAEEELEDIMIHAEDEQIPRQCLGPGCIEPAREGSKYCSDECGMKLATNRIFEIMPQRIQQWQATPCIAEENNKHALETIRNAQLEARRKLVQLDMKHKEMDVMIDRAKHATVSHDQETTDAEEENEMSIHCPTCGHEITQKAALKHMERCFNRFESQTSYGSIYKTRIDLGNMFCDYYNTQAKTYCKRLKVLCPEHSKEPKMSPDEVCGCPLVANIFQQTGEFCLARKRHCNKHYCWEKLRRAEIDMEKVRQWMKLDDLFEKERHIRSAMSCRAGVLGLVLHQTIDHDPMRPIKTVKMVS